MTGQLDVQEGSASSEVAGVPTRGLEQEPTFDFASIAASRLLEEPSSSGPPEAASGFRFRQYRLLHGARVLLRNEEPVAIGSRAFDLLYVLLCSRGKVVEGKDLLRQVWPTTVVAESNLRFQIASVRQVLGADRDLIGSVPGRGYFFVAESEDTGWAHRSSARRRGRRADDRLPSTVAPSALPQDPTGAQTPEDYKASCELLCELLSAVLHELRELRRAAPRYALPAPGHLAGAD